MANTQEIATRLLSDLQRDFGLSREQAAGVVGNLMHESGGFNSLQEVKPLVPGSRGGYGYAQWTGPRRNAFESFAGGNKLDPSSYEANYGFLKHELSSDPYERNQFMKVRGATTAEEAARLISENYLRPGIPHMDSRVNYANQIMGYMPADPGNAAVAAINRAAPKAQPKGGSFWSPFSNLMGGASGGIMKAAQINPTAIKQAAIGPMLASVDGRTAIMRALMAQNIGPAPTAQQGHMGGGSHAMAVNKSGSAPVTLMRASGSPSQSYDAQTHPHMNMDVYRANAAVLGPGNFNQSSINAAISSGKTLMRPV